MGEHRRLNTPLNQNHSAPILTPTNTPELTSAGKSYSIATHLKYRYRSARADNLGRICDGSYRCGDHYHTRNALTHYHSPPSAQPTSPPCYPYLLPQHCEYLLPPHYEYLILAYDEYLLLADYEHLPPYHE